MSAISSTFPLKTFPWQVADVTQRRWASMVNVAGAVRSAAYVLPPGEVGEVYITGPTFMKGYWNGPDATAQSPCSPPAPR